jgi:predicted amidohydrolase YtcJ
MPVLPKADIVLTRGRVFLGLAEGVAEAVALWRGRVLATGSASDMEPLIGPGTRVIELHGRLAAPGLCDSHMHLLPYGIIMSHVDVRKEQAPTLDALLSRLSERVAVTPPGGGSWPGATTISPST